LCFSENDKSRLQHLVGLRRFEFLGYVVNLDSGRICDSLKDNSEIDKFEFEVMRVLLSHYAKAEPVVKTDELIKFADLDGGHAYEAAFVNKAVKLLAETFGDEPEKLVACAERLGGRTLPFGDCSVEVPAFPRIPLTIILWRRSEFPAEANILYDKTANNYLPTEDLAVLGELMTARLIQTFEHYVRRNHSD
jgi:hypothetical protein